MKSLEPAADHELHVKEQEREDRERKKMRAYSEVKYQKIWTDEFIGEFFTEHDREPTESEIDIAWNNLDFDAWVDEYCAKNPGTE